jgi:TolB-like protein/Tfp pilus assembly protein PilF
VLRFASFELDVRSRELRRGTDVVRLQEQPFEILRAMLEHPGEVVTREELARRLWPDGTFVDFEHSLNAAVKRLRAALGDDADRPRFVETLPRRGYRFIAPMTPASRRETTGEVVRLAVLPFTNLSADARQEYFSDGLTDEMIAQLGRLGRGRLAVLAYWSSMVFKRTTQRAREIGETLQVDYVLEGSVRRDGDRVRIIARLVETASETPLWSETFDMRLADCLLSAQVDVAAQIARALQMELVPGDDDQPGGSHDAAAYQAYLKGRYHWNQVSVNRATGLLDEEGLAQAVAHLEDALRLDPGFAGAAAALARARIARIDYCSTRARAAFDAAEDAARRAIEIAPQLADAYIAMGDIRRMRDFDWRGAEAEYAQAIALNPSSEAAHRLYGLLLAALGRRREALHEAKRAHALDPLCLVASTSTAWVHYLAHDHRTAVEQCAMTLKLEPAFLPARRLMAAALQGLQRPDDAIAELEKALAQAPNDPVTLAWLVHARGAAGDASGAAAAAARVRAYGGPRSLSLYHLAIAELGDGHHAAALIALERAVDERDPAVANIATEPRFAPLHGNQCFTRLVDRLGLTAA